MLTFIYPDLASNKVSLQLSNPLEILKLILCQHMLCLSM